MLGFHQHKTPEEIGRVIAGTIDALPRRVHNRRELELLFRNNRQQWFMLARTNFSEAIEYLTTLHLEEITLTSPGYPRELVRYGWRSPGVFDVAQSIHKQAYICHK